MVTSFLMVIIEQLRWSVTAYATYTQLVEKWLK